MASRGEQLLHSLKKTYDRQKIEDNGEIWQPEQVKGVVDNHFDEVRLLWEDGKYRVCDIDTIEYVLKHSIVKELEYISTYFDCENFTNLFTSLTALQYHLNTVGKVINYKGAHAFSVALTKNDLYVIEPQSSSYWVYDEDKVKEKYQIENQILEI